MENDREIRLNAPWSEVREKIKEVNAELTDDDLRYIPGKDEEFLQQLGKKMDRSPEDVKAWIESLSSNRGKAS
jgi:uncharacterized protein YjbJ (UPF0337 family)